MVKIFFENCKNAHYSESEANLEYLRLLQEFDKGLEYSKEKTEVVQNLVSTYGKVVRKLDAELEKFRMELEADSSGVTSTIEHRITSLLWRSASAGRIEKRRPAHRASHLYSTAGRSFSRRRYVYDAHMDQSFRPARRRGHKYGRYGSTMLTQNAPAYNNSAMSVLGIAPSTTLSSDVSPRLLHGHTLQQMPSNGSVHSGESELADAIFDTLGTDSSQVFGTSAEDMDISVDSTKRPRWAGPSQRTPQHMDAPGREQLRLMGGYTSTYSPLVSSEPDVQGMATGATSSSTLAYSSIAGEASIDDLLVSEDKPLPSLESSAGIHRLGVRLHSTTSASLMKSSSLASMRTCMSQSPDPHGNSGTFFAVAGESPQLGRDRRAPRSARRPARINSLLLDAGSSGFDDLDPDIDNGCPIIGSPVDLPSSSSMLLAAVNADDDDDQDQQRYCTCRDVSYGDMIACDAPSCPIEWFHYVCVGLVVAPKGQWFCPDCIKSGIASRGSRKRGIRR